MQAFVPAVGRTDTCLAWATLSNGICGMFHQTKPKTYSCKRAFKPKGFTTKSPDALWTPSNRNRRCINTHNASFLELLDLNLQKNIINQSGTRRNNVNTTSRSC